MSDIAHRKLWAADPHQYGPGKIHICDPEADDKTLCGRFMSAIPGKWQTTGSATCRICLDAVVRRPEQERARQEAEVRRVEYDQQRAREQKEWNDWYQGYLRSPEWAVRRERVLKRANGACEGCGIAKAVQVHHTTYAHVGDEFLWELRAICRACHERVTEIDRATRERK